MLLLHDGVLSDLRPSLAKVGRFHSAVQLYQGSWPKGLLIAYNSLSCSPKEAILRYKSKNHVAPSGFDTELCLGTDTGYPL